MRRSLVHRRATVVPGLLAALCWVSGCQDRQEGPKRQDHAAAHAARYHPDIHGARGVASSSPAASQPFDVNLPTRIPEGATGNPVLFVNGKPLTVQEVLEPILPQLREMAGSAPSEREYYRAIGRLIAEEIRHQASTILIYEEARKKLPDSIDETLDKEADKAIQRVINARFGGARARYETHLRALDLTMNDVKERIKRQLLVSNYLNQRFEPLVSDPPRRELLKYYQTHLNEFTTPARAELLMIEIPLQDELGKPVSQATEQELAAARQRARDVLRRAREELDSGADFPSVARRYSRGAQRANGGSWGEISPGALVGSYARAAEVLFNLDSGQISEIIETEDSSFFVKCGRKTPEKRLAFEEAQTHIVEQVRTAEYDRLTTGYINELLANAGIDGRQQEAFFIAAVVAAPRPNTRQAGAGNNAGAPN